MKVILATGIEDLDKCIRDSINENSYDIEIVGEVYYRGALNNYGSEIDVVIISEELPGDDDDFIGSAIYPLRAKGIRIILLPGDKDSDNTMELVKKCTSLGIYDYVFNSVTVDKIIDRLLNPATLGDVQKLLKETAIPEQSLGENTEDFTPKKTIRFGRKEKQGTNTLMPADQKKKQIVLLATGDDAINESIATSIREEIVIANNRDSLIEIISNIVPDIVILSSELPGDMDILEAAYQVKQVTSNVIFIAGAMEQDDITLARIKEMGIVTLVGNISIGVILKTILSFRPQHNKASNHDDSDLDSDEKRIVIGDLVKTGTKIAKNIPNVSIPKIKIKKKAVSINPKLIAVVSPISAGKTFVAVNLATAISQMGYAVALIDGDTKNQSIHTWFAMEPGETGLPDAGKDNDPLPYAFQHPMIPNLYIFSSDPFDEESQEISVKGMSNLIDSLNEYVDVIIVDTSSDLTDLLTKSIIDTAANVVLVADQDFNHLLNLQIQLDKLENTVDFNKMSLIVNRTIQSDNVVISDAEKAAGLQAETVIPEMTKEVLESIKSGIPAALFCPDIKHVFEELWHQKERQMELA